MASEDELLKQLAERPEDRSLRLVFSDWLQEQGDPRGEVIAMWGRGHLSLTERRRMQRLTEQHAAQWLGPIAAVADVPRCRWEGGFPVEIVLAARGSIAWAPIAGDLTLRGSVSESSVAGAQAATPFIAPLIGDPRWATVKSLVFPLSLGVSDVVSLLSHPVFARLKRLEAGARVLAQLKAPMRPAFTLDAVALASWATFAGDLEALLEGDALGHARRLELATSEFVNPIVAREIRETVLRAQIGAFAPAAPAQLGEAEVAQSAVLARYDEVRLLAPYGVMEGVAAWLMPPQLSMIERTWSRGRAWSAAFSDVLYTLERTSDRLLRRLTIDLTGPEGTLGLGQRLATVAGVLVLLAAAKLHELEVLLPEGARLRPAERDALRAAVRRLGTVQSFRIAGQPVTP